MEAKAALYTAGDESQLGFDVRSWYLEHCWLKLKDRGRELLTQLTLCNTRGGLNSVTLAVALRPAELCILNRGVTHKVAAFLRRIRGIRVRAARLAVGQNGEATGTTT